MPIYATQSVITETGINADTFSDSDDDDISEATPTLEELEAQLKMYENNEEYEKAAELLEKINKLNSEKEDNN